MQRVPGFTKRMIGLAILVHVAWMFGAGLTVAEEPKAPAGAALKRRVADINKRVADEYATLADRQISPVASAAIVEWLKKTLK